MAGAPRRRARRLAAQAAEKAACVPLPPPKPEPETALTSALLSKPEKLSELTELALDRAFDILRMQIADDDPNRLRLLSMQQATIGDVLRTQIRADEAALKVGKIDKLDEILQRLRDEDERRRLPPH